MNSIQAKAEMLIRKPVDEVFEAFINPDITTQFWFTKSSGRLEAGKTVQWDWEMYNASAQVHVKTVEPNKRIVIDWGNIVEWTFTARDDGTTFVSIVNEGFQGSDEEIIKEAIGSSEAFAIVLAGLKALLEHQVQLNLIRDRFPG
jgi:uncharacterized protein YndB with AHSA1/START domain